MSLDSKKVIVLVDDRALNIECCGIELKPEAPYGRSWIEGTITASLKATQSYICPRFQSYIMNGYWPNKPGVMTLKSYKKWLRRRR